MWRTSCDICNTCNATDVLQSTSCDARPAIFATHVMRRTSCKADHVTHVLRHTSERHDLYSLHECSIFSSWYIDYTSKQESSLRPNEVSCTDYKLNCEKKLSIDICSNLSHLRRSSWRWSFPGFSWGFWTWRMVFPQIRRSPPNPPGSKGRAYRRPLRRRRKIPRKLWMSPQWWYKYTVAKWCAVQRERERVTTLLCDEN